MSTTAQIAKHLRDVHFGGNWTAVNLKDSIAGLSWQQATAKIYNLNTIAALVFHMNYYVDAILKVLRGGPLEAHDKYSFDVPDIRSQEDWEKLLNKVWKDAEDLAALIEQLPDSKLPEIFTDAKYGSYYRNFQGMIEHFHYHLGQIAVIRKILDQQ
ncbi:MAG: DinB family protein [Chitinophagaceae bacterium]|nr:DinB family protein [Chitinophagaceae bacterium]